MNRRRRHRPRRRRRRPRPRRRRHSRRHRRQAALAGAFILLRSKHKPGQMKSVSRSMALQLPRQGWATTRRKSTRDRPRRRRRRRHRRRRHRRRRHRRRRHRNRTRGLVECDVVCLILRLARIKRRPEFYGHAYVARGVHLMRRSARWTHPNRRRRRRRRHRR
jgi:hypothetical protein